jgi:hypothetical protein
MSAAADTWGGVGCSPIKQRLQATIQTKVRPEKGAKILGLAYRMAKTQHRGFKMVMPNMPDNRNINGHHRVLCTAIVVTGDDSDGARECSVLGGGSVAAVAIRSE